MKDSHIIIMGVLEEEKECKGKDAHSNLEAELHTASWISYNPGKQFYGCKNYGVCVLIFRQICCFKVSSLVFVLI